VLALFSTALTLAVNPFGELKRRLIDVTPWAGAGFIVSETMFIGGIMIMAWAVGLDWGNPLKLRKTLAEIYNKANGSRPFWLGFWINSLGSVGSSAILSIGLILYLPPESYGLLGVAVLDLAATVVVRKAIWSGARKAVT
jgi:hypothetical protein